VKWVTDRSQVVELDIAPVGRVDMFLNPLDRVITPLMQAHRVWEPTETRLFLDTIRPGDTVVDVGANVGYYTLLAAEAVGPTGRVFAFEPDPVAFALLEDNVRLSGATNVIAEQKALSNEPGSIKLFLAAQNKGDHRIVQVKGQDRPSVDIEAVAFDQWIRTHPVANGGSVDFIKIDTQGAEAVILEGMKETLKNNDGIRLIVEFWPSGLDQFGADAGKVLSSLSAADFRFLELPPRLGMAPIVRTAQALLSEYTVKGRRFTSLLLIKGAAEYARLAADVEAAGKKLAVPAAQAVADPAADKTADPAAQAELDKALEALRAFNDRSMRRDPP